MALPALALVGFSGLGAQEANKMENVPVPEQSLMMESGLLASSYSLERERERELRPAGMGFPQQAKPNFQWANACNTLGFRL